MAASSCEILRAGQDEACALVVLRDAKPKKKKKDRSKGTSGDKARLCQPDSGENCQRLLSRCRKKRNTKMQRQRQFRPLSNSVARHNRGLPSELWLHMLPSSLTCPAEESAAGGRPRMSHPTGVLSLSSVSRGQVEQFRCSQPSQFRGAIQA